jgi:hypothetical protein
LSWKGERAVIKRKIEKELQNFFQTQTNKALLVTGARQVGKTYIIREFLHRNFSSVVEINFIENRSARELFADVNDSKDILLRLSAVVDQPLIKGETVFFFDEVQECRELVTAIKFLVQEGSYRYILSGSMLGVELKDIRSLPVGYMDILEMYPLDFEEFCTANGVSDHVIENLEACFRNKIPVDEVVHQKMMELFKLYLIIGGMPNVVDTYIQTNNIRSIMEIQHGINRLYKQDIAKYDFENKLYLEEIFELIPSELNNKNKRFILKNLNENFKFSRYENSFLWLKDAGVALPVYCAQEPLIPLRLSRATNLFKLFLADVGLLAEMYANGLQIDILSGKTDLNFGAIYENVVAQELKAHGFELYYFNSKKQGELDFLIEYQGKVLPIEVKSGKNFQKHCALNNVMQNPGYGIGQAFVFCNENVSRKGNVMYYPIYMISFIRKERQKEDLFYRIDLDALK